MRKATTFAALVLTVSAVLALAATNSNERQPLMSLDRVLAEVSDAIASADTEKMELLILPPDASEDGRNRKSVLAEIRKDWADVESGPPVKLNPKRAVIQIDMDDLDPDGPPGGHISTIDLKLVLTDDGWRIEAMRTPKRQVRGRRTRR